MYEDPELMQPKQKAVGKELSNVNSSVYLFMDHKNTPTQKPMHIGQ